MNSKEILSWISSMEYDLKKLEITESNIKHLKSIRKADIKFLKKELKKSKENNAR